MVSYLRIQKLFPDMEDRIKQLVNQDRIQDVEVLVADIPELQQVKTTSLLPETHCY